MFAYFETKFTVSDTEISNITWNYKPDHSFMCICGRNYCRVIGIESNANNNTDLSDNFNIFSDQKLNLQKFINSNTMNYKCSVWANTDSKYYPVNITARNFIPKLVSITYNDEVKLDSNYTIVVWSNYSNVENNNYDDIYFEESINFIPKNRIVTDIRVVSVTSYYNRDVRIGYILHDGGIGIGSLITNKLLVYMELGFTLNLMEFSPDGAVILLCSNDSIHVYDQFITPIGTLNISDTLVKFNVVALEWASTSSRHIPSLSIVFESGLVQIMRGYLDESPVVFDTNNKCLTAKWAPSGNILAIATLSGAIQFYTPFGRHLTNLSVGNSIRSIAWEGTSLHLAVATSSEVLFATIKPEYICGFFNNTFTYSCDNSPGMQGLVFWDIHTGKHTIKKLSGLICLRACASNCVLITREGLDTYHILLCNSIGGIIATKLIDIVPIHVEITASYVIIASSDIIYFWAYSKRDLAAFRKENREEEKKFLLVDDTLILQPQSSNISHSMSSISISNIETDKKTERKSFDEIVSICAGSNTLLIIKSNGQLLKYSLPQLILECKSTIKIVPTLMKINCDETRLAIIDNTCTVSLYFLDNSLKLIPNFEVKNVWSLKWSEDDPESFVLMQKAKMCIYKNTTLQEYFYSDGLIFSFSQFTINAVLYDNLLTHAEQPAKECLLLFETKELVAFRNILALSSLEVPYQYVSDHPNKIFWKILAEESLQKYNFVISEKAFVKCKDHFGIQTTKKLQLLDDVDQQAEIAIYFKKFDLAEDIYVKHGYKDKAVQLRIQLGDFFRAHELLQSGWDNTYEQMIPIVQNEIGRIYFENSKWEKAAEYFRKTKDFSRLITCYYNMEDYASLERIIGEISNNQSELLIDVGDKLASIGLCHAAVNSYLKAGESIKAIDACVKLNHWDLAIKLSKQHNFSEIDALLKKSCDYYLERDRIFVAVELYRNANRRLEAVKLLMIIASQQPTFKPVRLKQLYVIASMEAEKCRGSENQDENYINTLIKNLWHHAEAYHFYLICIRQLYSGQYNSALRTSTRLCLYEDIIKTEYIYALRTLSSLYNEYYSTCSESLNKLENLDSLSDEQRSDFHRLRQTVFSQKIPIDPVLDPLECPNPHCEANITEFSVSCTSCHTHFLSCIVTGQSIFNQDTFCCSTCHHYAIAKELGEFKFCPFCHAVMVS